MSATEALRLTFNTSYGLKASLATNMTRSTASDVNRRDITSEGLTTEEGFHRFCNTILEIRPNSRPKKTRISL